MVWLFGMPVAHDDDPLRAVRAALALHAQVEQIGKDLAAQLGVPLRMHSGIQTGLVLFTKGGEHGGVYAITGDTVNTAARLRSQAGPGEILVGPATQRAIAPFFKTDAGEPLVLKGKAEPLAAHRVVGRSALHSRFDVSRARGLHAHVGRTAELDALRARLEHARGGELQCAGIVGDPGMGKSRLLHELQAIAERGGHEVLLGRCEPFGSVAPYQPFLSALRQRLELHGRPSVADATERVTQALLAIAPELSPHLPGVLQLLSLGGGASETSPAALHEQIAGALCAVLEELAKASGLVVVLEDWHWADEASDRLLQHLLAALAERSVLVAVSYRPDRKPGWERRAHALLELSSLAGTETAALARDVLGVDAVSEGLSHLLYERTSGNPLFIEEFCRALREAKCLVIEERAARLSPAAEIGTLPEGVHALIRSRIDRLAEVERKLLALAAVIGVEFSTDLLALVGEAPAELSQALERLEEAGMVRRQEGEGAYAFRHALIQQVTYEAVLKSDRRALHARVAQSLEATFADGRIAEHYESLARHFGAGGAADKAAHYSELAGDKAAAAYALESAAHQYRRAIEHLDGMPASDTQVRRRVDMTLKWGRASIWRPSPAHMDLLRSSVELARRAGYERGAARALYWLGWHDYTLGNQIEAVLHLEASLEAARKLSDLRLMAQACANLAYCHAAGRVYPRAQSFLRQMEDLQQRSAIDRLWGSIYSLGYEGLIAGDRGEFDCAYELLDRALAQTLELRDVPTHGSVLTQIGLVQAQQGQFEGLRATARELHAVGERVEAYYLLAMSKTFEGYAELHLGDASRALPPMQEAVDALEEMSLMLTMSFNYACLAEGLARAEQPERAERVARQALLRGLKGDRLGDVMGQRALAIAAVHRPEPDTAAALAHLEHAARLADEHELPREALLTRLCRAEVLALSGDLDAAASEARALQPELARMHMPYYVQRCEPLVTGAR
jgi:tetratricopeptide (TPR) repeat protein